MCVEIDIAALVILLIIFANIHSNTENNLPDQRLFRLMMLANAVILLLDIAMWLLDGRPGSFARWSYPLISALYDTMNPLLCLLWSLYADYFVCRSTKRLKRLLLPLLLPCFVVACLAFASITLNGLFYIDANNVYHRGRLFFIMAVSSYFYLIYTDIFIIVKQKKIPSQNFISMLAFALPPFIGGIIQVIYYGISLLWICTTISILIIFINIQNYQLYTDYLTGLFNRRQLDNYLYQTLNPPDGKMMAGLMIDLNSFKTINDKYGHNSGDEALKQTARLLEETFRKNDFIARYGGDEFVVIMEIKKRSDMEVTVNRLKDNVAQFNARKIVPFDISLSVGCDTFDSKDKPEKFIRHIDNLMYKDKQKYSENPSK